MGKRNLNLHQFGHQQVFILLMNPDLYQHAKLMFWIQVFFFFFPWLVIWTGRTKTPLGTLTWNLAFMLLVILHHNVDVVGHKQSKAGIEINKRAQGHNYRWHSAWQNYRDFPLGKAVPCSLHQTDLPWMIHSCWSPGRTSRHQPCSLPEGILLQTFPSYVT